MIGTELEAELRGGPKLSCDACGHLETRGKPPAKHIKKTVCAKALSAGSPFMAPQTKRAACLVWRSTRSDDPLITLATAAAAAAERSAAA